MLWARRASSNRNHKQMTVASTPCHPHPPANPSGYASNDTPSRLFHASFLINLQKKRRRGSNCWERNGKLFRSPFARHPIISLSIFSALLMGAVAAVATRKNPRLKLHLYGRLAGILDKQPHASVFARKYRRFFSARSRPKYAPCARDRSKKKTTRARASERSPTVNPRTLHVKYLLHT